MAIKVEHLNHIYGQDTIFEQYALKDVSLTIGDGEFVGLIGHTGSGKSTLTQHLNGLLKASSGDILYNGTSIYSEGYSLKELRSHVGLVFQYPEHQLFGATVVEDVQFGPRNLGWEPLEVELSAFQALKDVGIGEDLLDVSPLALSGGQKRRVALAGVLAMKPEYLILDEPMAGLDPAGRREVFQMLLKLHRERNMSILFVSHSMEDVAEYAERVIVMHQGKVVLDGAARQIFRFEKELEQIGLRVPQTARFMHRLRDDGFPLKEECITPQEAVECILRQRGKSVR